MIDKKKILSTSTGLVIASLLLGVGNIDAATHKVQKGESLWSISQKYATTVSNIKELNNLHTTFIYPNQVLEVGSDSSNVVHVGGSTADSKVISSGNSSNITNQYIVKAGDTLWKISQQFNVSLSNLKEWNNLKSDTIYVGQTLTINGKASISEKLSVDKNHSTSTSDIDYDVNKVISIARSLAGTPYVWGGTSPKGFDCSGFVYYVYKQAGLDINRLSAAGYYDRSYYVDKPQPGDLIFFKNTYKKGISDVGIYLGNNQFISSASKSVSIKSLDNSYWKSHFDSFKRFY